MLFDSIDVEYDGDWIILRGMNSAAFLSDVARIYKYRFDPENLNKGKMFFKIVQSGVMIKKLSFAFHKWFSVEMYYMFEKLYDITQRSQYKEIVDLLMKQPNVARYFTPLLSLPVQYTNRINKLKMKLFPYQEHFIETYYNAKKRLNLDGYILAFGMGLGKTFTAIATAYVMNIIPTIITAPRSTLDGWKKSIINIIPNIKPEEIKISYEYNPSKDAIPWKFFICNYERLDQALDYSKYAINKPIGLLCDEAHNFRNLDTNRTKMLVNLKNSLDIHDIIAISGTPILSLASELISIMKLIDPEFDDTASLIFNRIYSSSQYNTISGSVLRNRFNMYIEQRKQEDSIKLPPKERYTVEVKLHDPKPYLVSTMKANVWKYVNEHFKEYQSIAKPSLNEWESLIKNPIITENFSKEDIEMYHNAVILKFNNPRDLESANIINNFEKELLKPLDQKFYKELWTLRRRATSWSMMLIGKALGIYYTKQKINLISQMVKENVNEIAKIINEAEMKTIIFSTFIEPLYSIKDALEEQGIGCILHSGQDDIRVTRERFQNDSSIKALLGTIGSIGVGTDGLQYIANVEIFVNRHFRDAINQQVEARTWRRGQSFPVKFYYFKLNTDNEPNILDSEEAISNWSREIVRIAIS